MRYMILICCLGIMFGCNSLKKGDANDYSTGTVFHSSFENDCAYTIKVTTNNLDFVYFDPINLEKKYMKDKMKVKFKYRALRMQNRCDKANPVSITEIMEL